MYSTNIDCFVRDSLHLPLTFVAFCLLSVIHKQWLKQYNYSTIQAVLMTEFQTDFASSVRNFCRWVADVPPRKTSPSGHEHGEMSVFAGYKIYTFAYFFLSNSCPKPVNFMSISYEQLIIPHDIKALV